jgi:hypothetical protein
MAASLRPQVCVSSHAPWLSSRKPRFSTCQRYRAHVAIRLIRVFRKLGQELHLLKDLHILTDSNYGTDPLLLQFS